MKYEQMKLLGIQGNWFSNKWNAIILNLTINLQELYKNTIKTKHN